MGLTCFPTLRKTRVIPSAWFIGLNKTSNSSWQSPRYLSRSGKVLERLSRLSPVFHRAAPPQLTVIIIIGPYGYHYTTATRGC
jgi:hypothetical protein